MLQLFVYYGSILNTKKQESDFVTQKLELKGLEPLALSVENVRSLICEKATDSEIRMFLELCRAQDLNPFIKEAYLIVYKPDTAERKTTMIIAKSAFMRRAEAHPGYIGFKAGIVVVNSKGEMFRLESGIVPPGHILIGGWCSGQRQGREIFTLEVALSEYNLGWSLWKSHPATMIRKVAIVQWIREMFPGICHGFYTDEEISPPGLQVAEKPSVESAIESTASELPACSACGKSLTPSVAKYSSDNFNGVFLCVSCQAIQKDQPKSIQLVGRVENGVIVQKDPYANLELANG